MQRDIIITDDRVAKWRQRVWHIVQIARTCREFWEASMQYIPDNSAQLAIQGWGALRAGDYEYAQHCFRAAIHLDPYSASAWAGLSHATKEQEERRAYMQAAFDLHYLITQVEHCRQYD